MPDTDIQSLLKSAEAPIRNYIAALESENLKLHKQIAKLQVKHVSSDNRISALEDEIKELHGKTPDLLDLSEEELKEEALRITEKLRPYINKSLTQRSSGASLSLRPINFALYINPTKVLKMNEKNPYTEGTFDWISFEWSNLAAEFVKQKTIDPFRNLPENKWDDATKDLKEIEDKIKTFKSLYFP